MAEFSDSSQKCRWVQFSTAAFVLDLASRRALFVMHARAGCLWFSVRRLLFEKLDLTQSVRHVKCVAQPQRALKLPHASTRNLNAILDPLAWYHKHVYYTEKPATAAVLLACR